MILNPPPPFFFVLSLLPLLCAAPPPRCTVGVSDSPLSSLSPALSFRFSQSPRLPLCIGRCRSSRSRDEWRGWSSLACTASAAAATAALDDATHRAPSDRHAATGHDGSAQRLEQTATGGGGGGAARSGRGRGRGRGGGRSDGHVVADRRSHIAPASTAATIQCRALRHWRCSTPSAPSVARSLALLAPALPGSFASLVFG